MTGHQFAAIILAAGSSRRMGKFKPLLPLGHTTVIEKVLSIFQSDAISPPVVVVGHNQEEFVPFLKQRNVVVVENPGFHAGMFTSIQRGVAGLPANIDAFFIMPVDIPFVQADTIKRLMEAYEGMPGHIIRPCYKGKAGHPPLIPMFLSGEILASNGDGGLRQIIRRNFHITTDVNVLDGNILFDMDWPKDYDQGLSLMKSDPIRSQS